MSSPTKDKRPPENNDSDSSEDVEFSDEEGGLRVDGIYIPPPPRPYCSVENKGPRLIITNITNNFFKSYAGTQVLGPFHKCFNAIVGPNGSGKSNVIDSMLFVFGFRATKIRSKKISVLLHNSEQYPHVQSCTVAVHFALIVDKEGDDYDVVPGSEFIVARTANKDNSSYYTLNGRKVHFKEVALVLRKHGIDLDHNRFLILQGEVEQIAMMNPKGNGTEPGMLEYLEDIIGTTRYKQPLAQLATRVEHLSEQRSEKLNRLKLVQNELDELKEPMEEAVQFLKLENHIITKRNLLYQKNIAVLEENSKGLLESENEIKTSVAEFEERMNAIVTERESKMSELKEVSEKHASLEKRKEAMKDAFDKANKKDIQLQAEMTQINKNRKKTKELLAEEQKKLEGYKRAPQDAKVGIAECEKLLETAISKKETLEEQKTHLLANLRNQTKDLQEKKESIQMELVELNKIVDEAKSSYMLAESELKIYMSNHNNETKKFQNLRETYAAAETKIAHHTNEVEKLKKLIPERETKLRKANEQLLQVKTEEHNIVNELRRKRMSLEERKSSMNAMRSRGQVLDALMQQKREGHCPGLFGRLGDLGAIDSKYDVAISTACGPLDNIVVDTVDTAQWCIEFLKKHNVGRSTFIALEKQEHLRKKCQAPFRAPENVPRLFDLIRIEDERVRTAFYYGLRDTLVADNLDQGSRIAYGATRHRVVTLGGDLIETMGTMSGGGKQVSRGRMGQSVASSNINPKEIEGMEIDVNNMERKLSDLRKKQTNLETEINELNPELRQMKIALEKCTIELQSLRQQHPVLAKQLEAQEQKMKNTTLDQKEVDRLTAVVNERKAAYDAAVENTSELQSEVDELTKTIKEKTQGKVSALDKSIKETTKQIDKCKSEITRLQVGLKTAERNSVKSVEKIATMEQDITNAENTLRKLKAQREEIEVDADKLLKCIEEISANLVDGEEEFAAVKKTVEKLTKKENHLKAEKIEIDQKLKEVKEKVKNIKDKINSWQAKIADLKYQEIPDDTTPELKSYTKEELEAQDIQNVQKQLQTLEEEFKKAKPNLNAIVEYRKKQQVFIGRSKELEEVTDKRKKMRSHFDNLHTRRKDEFTAGFNIIKMKLKEMYQMITLGGDADFELLDTFDPFNEGVQLKIRPPKKTWKVITNLSGGEKTLSSLALVFALHYYKPSPLYVMDEIDAALDFKNVSIVGNYIKERTKNAQFVIISLRSNMFELCDYLIGIYKTNNCTKSVVINPRLYDFPQEVTQKKNGENVKRLSKDPKEALQPVQEHEENPNEEHANRISTEEAVDSIEKIPNINSSQEIAESMAVEVQEQCVENISAAATDSNLMEVN